MTDSYSHETIRVAEYRQQIDGISMPQKAPA